MSIFTSIKLEMTPPMPSRYEFVVVFMTLSSTAAASLRYDGMGMFKYYTNKLQIAMREEEERWVFE